MRQLITDCADWPKFDTLDNGKRRKFRGISEVYVAKLQAVISIHREGRWANFSEFLDSIIPWLKL